MEAYIRGIGNISPQLSWDKADFPAAMNVYEGNRLKCIEPDYKEFIKPIQMRRMSRTLKMGVAAAGRCLRDAGVDVPDAIIAGTGLGMMQDTEKFLTAIIENEEKFLTPTAFIQSTHNTVGAHIAVMLKCNKYNLTYVNENLSFESALLDSMIRIQERSSENVLLTGIDELTDAYFTISKNAGFWKEDIASNAHLLEHSGAGSIGGEGASFFLVTGNEQADNYARFRGVSTFYKPSSDDETLAFINDFLASKDLEPKQIDLLITGMNGDPKSDAVYERMQKMVFADIPAAYFKHFCGEYHTASGFAAWMAAMILKTQKCPDGIMLNGQQVPKEFKNILIYNQTKNTNHSLILLSAC